MRALVDEHGIREDRCLITSVPHDEIHRWLPWIDFGLLLLVSPNDAKRASMPTKLGEFLAAGVSPISYGGNSEVADWVRRTGSGLALNDLSDESLARAARFVAAGAPEPSARMRARQVAEEHFSLDSGAERYNRLFRSILARRERRARR
jgi:glycosyltransferase involved in cell wall biosynthesis